MDDVREETPIIEVPTSEDALIVVDMQNDFCPGGSLAVEGGDEIIEGINELACEFENVILTQDWHPADHSSFFTQHKGAKAFDIIEMRYGTREDNLQMLWPPHCIQGTPGADFHKDLDIPHARLIARKGVHKEVDSYSAFYENDWSTSVGVKEYLRGIDVNRVYVCGLALDYCVAHTAGDAARYGFQTFVIIDLCKGIGMPKAQEASMDHMKVEKCELVMFEEAKRLLRGGE